MIIDPPIILWHITPSASTFTKSILTLALLKLFCKTSILSLITCAINNETSTVKLIPTCTFKLNASRGSKTLSKQLTRTIFLIFITSLAVRLNAKMLSVIFETMKLFLRFRLTLTSSLKPKPLTSWSAKLPILSKAPDAASTVGVFFLMFSKPAFFVLIT